MLEGWVRFWYKGKLLPLPGELQQALESTRQQLRQSIVASRRPCSSRPSRNANNA